MKSRISIRSRLKEFMIYCISRGLILILLIFVCYSTLFWLLSGFDNVVFVKVHHVIYGLHHTGKIYRI